MNYNNINELNISEIASGSKFIKIFFVFLLCALVIGIGYYYIISESKILYTQEKNKELELKSQFESKAMLAANYHYYKVQIINLEKMVDTQLKQLPNDHEVAGLLDDISFIATDNGLKLTRINWEPEVKHEFSTELPMRIEVIGRYHEIANFSADMAALPRIVILDSFNLNLHSTTDDIISMSMLAKTYKYNGKVVEQKK